MFRFKKLQLWNKSKSNPKKALKVIVNVPKLTNFLGSANNIMGTEHTRLKVKIFVQSSTLVNSHQLRKLRGVTGLIVGRNYVTIIVGNQAKALANMLVQISKS